MRFRSSRRARRSRRVIGFRSSGRTRRSRGTMRFRSSRRTAGRTCTNIIDGGNRTINGRGQSLRLDNLAILIVDFSSRCLGTSVTLSLQFGLAFGQVRGRHFFVSRLWDSSGFLGRNLDIIITGVFIAIQGNSQLGTAHPRLNVNRIIRGVAELEVKSRIIHSGILSNRYVRRRPPMIIPGDDFQVGANDSTIQGGRGLADTAAILLN